MFANREHFLSLNFIERAVYRHYRKWNLKVNYYGGVSGDGWIMSDILKS